MGKTEIVIIQIIYQNPEIVVHKRVRNVYNNRIETVFNLLMKGDLKWKLSTRQNEQEESS